MHRSSEVPVPAHDPSRERVLGPARIRQRIRVTGTVQGVGYRPFVHRLARELHIVGCVGNDAAGVWIEAEADSFVLVDFVHRLRAEAPPLAEVTDVRVDAALPATDESEFVVAVSHDSGGESTALPPDTAMCAACAEEISDPRNRRYRHPFATCTDCGPRLSITTALPYDRPNTTMAEFPMCSSCNAEYHDPTDRRFHAQPIACNECGPTLQFVVGGEVRSTRDGALADAMRVLQSGGIVAVKGVGGFHLACDARNALAVQLLRERKGRGDKPFALLARNRESVRRVASISAADEVALTSPQAPIVLLTPAKHAVAEAIANSVAPGNGRIGVMLPPTPLHLLLLSEHPAVIDPAPDLLVLTSCNRSDEPICIDNESAMRDFDDIADAVLLHDRRIHVPCDDSVVRITAASDGELVQHVRRSRGYAPTPLLLPSTVAPTLAVGGELKTAICVAAGERAWMSQHIGDTGDYATMQMLDRVAEVLSQVQRVRPERYVADRHPAYLSRRWAQAAAEAAGAEFVDVQHHHAHFASLLAEHRIDPDMPWLGVTFDGTGFGDDGSIWGGEFLLGSYAEVQRVGSLVPVALPGGDAAVKRPARIALAHLFAAGIAWDPALPPVAACAGTEASVVRRMLETGTSCVETTSAGRLFDAVSALAGIAQDAAYEGQAAIELEAVADMVPAGSSRYAVDVCMEDRVLLDPGALLGAVARDVLNGVSSAAIAHAFHTAMADGILAVAQQIRASHGVCHVGLTGGVFQNALLTRLTAKALHDDDFAVLVHRRVPANDGGLALGQVLVAEHATFREK